MTIPMVDALRVLAEWRRDEIVVCTMGAAREWPRLSQHPLDVQYLPSAMGHATALGLGLALAQPSREVIVLSGDGGLLMSLGTLVTIVASGATNLTLVVLDNGRYEVTGGQATAAARCGADFAGLARAAGFANVAAFDALGAWQARAADCLARPGPRCLVLAVAPVLAGYELPTPTPLAERLQALRHTLTGTA